MDNNVNSPKAKTRTLSRSFSSPTLGRPHQTFNDQLVEFADKFVDVSIDPECSQSSAPSSVTFNEENESWINAKLGHRTIYCKHRHSCFENCWARGVVRTFSAGYIVQTSWSLVSEIFQIKLKNLSINDLSSTKIRSFLRRIYFEPNSLRFALGLTILSFTYKFSLCFIFRRLLNRFKKNQDSNDFIIKYVYPALSGFIAAFAALRLIPNKFTRTTLALFCMVRAIGDLLRVFGLLHKYHLETVIFALFQAPIMYAFLHKPSTMSKTYYKWILGMGALSQMQLSLLRILFKHPANNISDEFPLLSCNPIFHEKYENCLTEHCLDWCNGIVRAARIYIPVHWLPTILLTPKKIINNPWFYFKIKTINTLRSSIFLTTYQFNMKLTECLGRKWIGSDIGYVSMCGGLAAGLSILIEHPNRRSEIVLYVIPRAVEVLISHVPDNEYTKILSHDSIPTFIFSIAIGLWMGLRQLPGVIQHKSLKKHDEKGKKNVCNDLNMTVLSVIFGRFH